MSQYSYGMPPPAPVDPTNVAWKRVAAWFIDGVIYVILSNVVGFMLGTAPKFTSHDFSGDQTQAQAFCDAWRTTHQGMCSTSNGTATTIVNFAPAIWVFLGFFILYIVVQGLLGASLGKLALGLRIVKADGSKAGIGASAIRTVLWIVDAFTCGLPIIGGIAMFASRSHRRVGDMAAGTYVVDQHRVGQPVILPGDAGWGTYPPSQPGFGYGQPPGPPAVGPTGAPTAVTGAPWAAMPQESTATTTSGADYEADKPVWDEARKTYIQYDTGRQAWLEFDQQTQQWVPIST